MEIPFLAKVVALLIVVQKIRTADTLSMRRIIFIYLLEFKIQTYNFFSEINSHIRMKSFLFIIGILILL